MVEMGPFPEEVVIYLFKKTRSHIAYWRKLGLLPQWEKGSPRGYSFTDLLTIKVLWHLKSFGIQPSKVKDTLIALRAALPGYTNPLIQKRLFVRGKEIFIFQGGKAFEPRTGQFLLYEMKYCEKELRAEIREYLKQKEESSQSVSKAVNE